MSNQILSLQHLPDRSLVIHGHQIANHFSRTDPTITVSLARYRHEFPTGRIDSATVVERLTRRDSPVLTITSTNGLVTVAAALTRPEVAWIRGQPTEEQLRQLVATHPNDWALLSEAGLEVACILRPLIQGVRIDPYIVGFGTGRINRQHTKLLETAILQGIGVYSVCYRR